MINLISEIKRKKSAVVVGLDPRVDQLPKEIRDKHNLQSDPSATNIAAAIFDFNKGIIDAVADYVPAVKPQIAFYEVYGSAGYEAYEKTVKYASEKNLYVIGDVKRGDIGSTCDAYAKAHYEHIPTDAITVNAYLGEDGVKPFLKYTRSAGKGMFILVKTSNPSSGQLQDRKIDDVPVYVQMARLVKSWETILWMSLATHLLVLWLAPHIQRNLKHLEKNFLMHIFSSRDTALKAAEAKML